MRPTVTLNHDPLRTSGPFAVRDGIIDEYIQVESWSAEDTVRRLVRDVERGNDIVGVHAAFEPMQRYAIELRDRLGLPHNTVEDTLHVLDKAWVRRRLHAEGLTRLRHTTLSEALTWDTWQLFFPYAHPRATEIIDVCARFHQSLNVVDGATHIEVMVPDAGPIKLIDFNLRFAGIGAIALASDAFGIPFARYLADPACGKEPELSRLARPRRHAVDMAVMPPAGVTEFRDLTSAPGTTRHRANKKIGGSRSGRNNQIDSVAWFAVTGDSAAEAHRKAMSARAETAFNGAPVGDDPPLICPRHLLADVAAS